MKYSLFRLVTGGLAIYWVWEGMYPTSQALGIYNNPFPGTGGGNFPPPGIANDFVGIPEPVTTIQNNMPYVISSVLIAWLWMFSKPAPSGFDPPEREQRAPT